MAIMNMNKEIFEKITAEGKGPVLVEFQAPWCVYCKRLAPVLNKLSQEYEGRITVGQVNIDNEPVLAQKENIEVVPTLILYRNGQALGSIVAPESKAKLEAFIREKLEQQ